MGLDEKMEAAANPLLSLTPTSRFSVYSVKTLKEVALDVLCCEDVFEKARRTHFFANAWQQNAVQLVALPEQDGHLICPTKPGRPVFRAPSDTIPPGWTRSTKAMMKHNTMEFTLHNIANAESYAVDLFWDIIVRFLDSGPLLPREFFDDMVFIARQEADHFHSWQQRLADGWGVPFGSFPSNDTLWTYAMDTSSSLLERIAVITLTHEAKGLDSYLKLHEKLTKLGDRSSLAILENNIQDEIGHVACGVKWFSRLCREAGLQEREEFRRIYRKHFKGPLRPPFNKTFRDQAGLTEDWYRELVEGVYDSHNEKSTDCPLE